MIKADVVHLVNNNSISKCKLLNQAFAIITFANGLDELIIDSLDKRIVANVITKETLASASPDVFFVKYLTSHKKCCFKL